MNIVVPQLGESVIEARVARWLKHEGDAIAAGEPLVELETDKIDLEVSAEAAGILSRIERKDGDDVKVGEVLGVMETGAQVRRCDGCAGCVAGGQRTCRTSRTCRTCRTCRTRRTRRTCHTCR